MSTTTFERGDILLLNVPLGEQLEMAVRPVMVLQDCSAFDARVAIVPITPDPMVDCNSMLIPLGCFESARMGLITNAYLNAAEEILAPRQFVVRRIGKCPYRLLSEFLKTYRQNLGYKPSVTPSPPADVQGSFAPQTAFSRGST